MNDKPDIDAEATLERQHQRLKELMGEMVHCCLERHLLQAQRFHLGQAELKCLLLLGQERYLTPQSLAQKLEVAKSRVSVIVDRLAAKGLAVRADDPRDARVKLVGLTGAGRHTHQEVQAFIAEAHRALILGINPSQREEVLASLEALRASMELVRQSCAQEGRI